MKKKGKKAYFCCCLFSSTSRKLCEKKKHLDDSRTKFSTQRQKVKLKRQSKRMLVEKKVCKVGNHQKNMSTLQEAKILDQLIQ